MISPLGFFTYLGNYGYGANNNYAIYAHGTSWLKSKNITNSQALIIAIGVHVQYHYYRLHDIVSFDCHYGTNDMNGAVICSQHVPGVVPSPFACVSYLSLYIY